MIDLSRTKDGMLAEIRASGQAQINHFTDPDKSELLSLDEVSLTLESATPKELLQPANRVLLARFKDLPEERLFRDLTYPLKKGLGNAYKRGNLKDRSKRIKLEVTLTREGALMAISDEGNGFRVQEVLEKFESDRDYFTHGGSGFKQFIRARSVISYADGGRTMLLRFLCMPEPGRPPTKKDRARLGPYADVDHMKRVLALEVPFFKAQGRTIQSCRIYVSEKSENCGEAWYVVEHASGNSKGLKKATFKGRLLAEHSALKDFSMSRQLARGVFRNGGVVTIPTPVALLQHPHMAVFECQPAQGLYDTLKSTTDFGKVGKIIERLGCALRTLHESTAGDSVVTSREDEQGRLCAVRERTLDKVAERGSDRVEHVKNLFNKVLQQEKSLKPYLAAPIHGSFSWDCISFDRERLYLCNFENHRRSHPAIDIGGFLADLVRVYVLRGKGNPDFYDRGQEAFLESYFRDDRPKWREDMMMFVVRALLLRIGKLVERPEKKWRNKLDVLLDWCDQAV